MKEIETNIDNLIEELSSNVKFNDFKFLGTRRNENIVNVYIRKNNIIGSLELLISDISSTIKYEEIKNKNKYTRMFLNKFSHEFRNPLLNIIQLINTIKYENLVNVLSIDFEEGNQDKEKEKGKEKSQNDENKFTNKNTLITKKSIQNNANRPQSLLLNKQTISDSEKANSHSELIENLKHVKYLCKHLSGVIFDFDFVSNSQLDVNNQEAAKSALSPIPKNSNQTTLIKDNSTLFKELTLNLASKIYLKTDLIKLIKSCFKIVQTKIKLSDKDIKLAYELCESAPLNLKIDQKKLRQILMQILTNAYKYTNKGFINLKVFLKEEQIYFEISDSGIGLRGELLQKLNKSIVEFSRENTTNNIIKLGLFIVKKQICLLQGSLEFMKNMFQRTTVKFSIPFQIPENVNLLARTKTNEKKNNNLNNISNKNNNDSYNNKKKFFLNKNNRNFVLKPITQKP